jgi:DNA-binding GntR family transcriptional regulator
MTAGQEDRDAPGHAGSAAAVLTDRLAAMLVHREPGWRLPRYTALARRYGVRTTAIDAAIRELAVRNLVRRLPDGKVYRASPAEYLITLEGLPGLGTRIDPMGSAIACAAQHISRRRVPEDIGQVLGLPPGHQATMIRCAWTADGQPAALSTTYLPSYPGEDAGAAPSSLGAALNSQPAATPASVARPATLCMELQPPPPSAARSLRLAPGEAAVTVTVSFNGPSSDSPVALTIVVLRPGLFRIVVESRAQGTDDGGVGPNNRGL